MDVEADLVAVDEAPTEISKEEKPKSKSSGKKSKVPA